MRRSGFAANRWDQGWRRDGCLVAATRALLAWVAMVASGTTVRGQTPFPAMPPHATVLDVKDFGATGDGQAHSVREWVTGGRFTDWAALLREYPFVDGPKWTTDEAAFEKAKRALPAEGGTLHFPAGHYVAGQGPWSILRDNVKLRGEGAATTTLSTAADVAEGLVLAPYRHVGWLQSVEQSLTFEPESGARGSSTLQVSVPEETEELRVGQLIFIRNGANRFDQDYGEFNEIAALDPHTGEVALVYPLSRDYTLARLNHAGEVAAAFVMPADDQTVEVRVKTGRRFFQPAVGEAVTVGNDLFKVTRVAAGRLWLRNPGRGNSVPGTTIAAGAKIGKSRVVIRLTRSTRNFACEGLRIVGRRKVVNLSNSYHSTFTDCVFVRDLRAGGFSGGLTIDGDGGRFARFVRCTLTAQPAAGMQFARSFGSIAFVDCRFVNANVAFTEFNFDAEVVNSVFTVQGTRDLTNVAILGKSCGDLRFVGNRIQASGVTAVIDAQMDIQSQAHGSEGGVVIRGNVIEVRKVKEVFAIKPSADVVIETNKVSIVR